MIGTQQLRTPPLTCVSDNAVKAPPMAKTQEQDHSAIIRNVIAALSSDCMSMASWLPYARWLAPFPNAQILEQAMDVLCGRYSLAKRRKPSQDYAMIMQNSGSMLTIWNLSSKNTGSHFLNSKVCDHACFDQYSVVIYSIRLI